MVAVLEILAYAGELAFNTWELVYEIRQLRKEKRKEKARQKKESKLNLTKKQD
jgi:hypothetical protein